jgi:hypothetical protein
MSKTISDIISDILHDRYGIKPDVEILPSPSGGLAVFLSAAIPIKLSISSGHYAQNEAMAREALDGCAAMVRHVVYPLRPEITSIRDRQRGFE